MNRPPLAGGDQAQTEPQPSPLSAPTLSAQSEYRMALASDALAVAARVIAVNGLLAEGAARRGDEAETLARLRAVARALQEARDVYALASGKV